MLVESKYFQCEKCGEHSIRLIFAPQVETAIQLIEFSEMMKPDFKKENCEVWIIGAPEDETDPDCGHITMQAWPSQQKPKSIPASEFNKRIVSLEENHCSQTNTMVITQDQLDLVKRIDAHVKQFPENEVGTEQLLTTLYGYMVPYKKLMDTTTNIQMDYLNQNYSGLYRFAKLLEGMAQGISDGTIDVPNDIYCDH